MEKILKINIYRTVSNFEIIVKICFTKSCAPSSRFLLLSYYIDEEYGSSSIVWAWSVVLSVRSPNLSRCERVLCGFMKGY